MATNTTDEIFVDAEPADVYRALVTFGKDASWWPGARARSSGTRLSVRLPSGRFARVSFQANVGNVRPDEGLTWWIDDGEIVGRGEWWLEKFKDGTIVHYFLEAEPGSRRMRGMPARIRRHRWAIRRGLNALKDEMEGR